MTEDEDFQRRIASKESEWDRLHKELEAVRLEFLPLAAQAAARWWQDAAPREVQRNTAVTDALKDEELATLKTEVRELIASADTHAQSSSPMPTHGGT